MAMLEPREQPQKGGEGNGDHQQQPPSATG